MCIYMLIKKNREIGLWLTNWAFTLKKINLNIWFFTIKRKKKKNVGTLDINYGDIKIYGVIGSSH